MSLFVNYQNGVYLDVFFICSHSKWHDLTCIFYIPYESIVNIIMGLKYNQIFLSGNENAIMGLNIPVNRSQHWFPY